jgi:hypothetical protein
VGFSRDRSRTDLRGTQGRHGQSQSDELISCVHNGAPPRCSRADDFRAGGATRLTQRPLIIVEGHSSRNFWTHLSMDAQPTTKVIDALDKNSNRNASALR